jgi:hypothetical protein
MILDYHLIKRVQLLNRVFSYGKAILVKNGLLLVIDHLTLNILCKRVVRLSLCEDIHLIRDYLYVLDVLNRYDKHGHKVSHDAEHSNSELYVYLAV